MIFLLSHLRPHDLAPPHNPFQWEGQHVKGHQDRGVSYYSLSRLSQLNVQMDRMAKSFWMHLVLTSPIHDIPQPRSHPIHKELWQLWAGDIKITAPSTKELHSLIQDPITDSGQSYWLKQ